MCRIATEQKGNTMGKLPISLDNEAAEGKGVVIWTTIAVVIVITFLYIIIF